jgi:pyruvate formate lyase activating enzyme
MFIGGLEKLTLTDFPNKMACIVFLVNCNFKCPYCYNKELTAYKFFKKSKRQLIPDKEFFQFLEKNKKMLDGVVITGGEPTISPGLIEFMKKIKKMGFAIKLDSNGTNPQILEEALNKKLINYIAMDIKAPLKKYKDLTRTKISPKKIAESIEIIKNSNIPHEFRTTLYPKLKIEDFIEMAKLIQNETWYLQEFQGKNAYEPRVRKYKPMKKTKINKIIEKINKITPVQLRE